MYLIDTNIFLEVMLSRERSEECKKLLKVLKEGKLEGIVTDFTIHSIIVLLDKFRKLKALESFLKASHHTKAYTSTPPPSMER